MVKIPVEEKEIYAILVVLLLAFGIWHFPEKQTLPDFTSASQIRLALSGASVPLHIAIAAQAESAFALVVGASASSPQTIVNFLLLFPSLLLALSAVLMYLALRAAAFRRTVSAFASILFSLSLSIVPLMPGMYGSLQLAAPLFAAFVLCLVYLCKSKNAAAIIPAAILAVASAYISPIFGAAGALLSLSFAAGAYSRRERATSTQITILLALFLAGAFFSPEFSTLAFVVSKMQSIFSIAPFLVSLAAGAVIMAFFKPTKLEYAFCAAAGCIAAGFSPLAGSMLLVLPAAEGLSSVADGGISRKAKLAGAFVLAFFIACGLLLQFGEPLRAVMIGALIALMLPVAMHMYDYKNRQLFGALAFSILAFSVFYPAFLQLRQTDSFPQYADNDLSNALLSLSQVSPSSVALLSSADAAHFYLPGATIISSSDAAAYLASGKMVPESGTYVISSLSDIDSREAFPSQTYETFIYVSNLTSGSTRVALFASQSRLLVRELDSRGNLALSDGSFVDSSGLPYSRVPLSRMVLLNSEKPATEKSNRMLVLPEGAYLPHFVKIYSGQSNEIMPVSEYGKVSVFKVK